MALAVMLPQGSRPAVALQESYVFEGSGWGHGVGMSQWGAYGMAKQGFNYREILSYYYRGTKVSAWSCPAEIRVGLLEGQSSIELAPQSGSFTFYTSDGDVPGGVMAPGGTWTVELCRYQGYSRTHANTSGARRQPRRSLCSTVPAVLTRPGPTAPSRAWGSASTRGCGRAWPPGAPRPP